MIDTKVIVSCLIALAVYGLVIEPMINKDKNFEGDPDLQ